MISEFSREDLFCHSSDTNIFTEKFIQGKFHYGKMKKVNLYIDRYLASKKVILISLYFLIYYSCVFKFKNNIGFQNDKFYVNFWDDFSFHLFLNQRTLVSLSFYIQYYTCSVGVGTIEQKIAVSTILVLCNILLQLRHGRVAF